jgi:plastocyanin
MKNHWYKTASAGVLLLAVVFLAGCTAPEPQVEQQAADLPLIEQVGLERTDEGADAVTPEGNVVIEMDSFTEVVDGKFFPQYSQKEIRVNKGDKVTLKINTLSGTHDFVLDEFGVKSETPTGEVTTIEFVADKAGTFEYYCSKPRHRELGHKGTLIVQ